MALAERTFADGGWEGAECRSASREMKRQDGLARVADTIAEGKGRGYGRSPQAPPVGRGNAVPDKRERQSRAISKRPITGERSWKKKIARENRDSFVAGGGGGRGREQ